MKKGSTWIYKHWDELNLQLKQGDESIWNQSLIPPLSPIALITLFSFEAIYAIQDYINSEKIYTENFRWHNIFIWIGNALKLEAVYYNSATTFKTKTYHWNNILFVFYNDKSGKFNKLKWVLIQTNMPPFLISSQICLFIRWGQNNKKEDSLRRFFPEFCWYSLSIVWGWQQKWGYLAPFKAKNNF